MIKRESCDGENGQLRPVRRCGCRGALQHLSIQFLPPGACAPRSPTAVPHRAKVACGIACGWCVLLRTPAPRRSSSLTCACAASSSVRAPCTTRITGGSTFCLPFRNRNGPSSRTARPRRNWRPSRQLPTTPARIRGLLSAVLSMVSNPLRSTAGWWTRLR